MLDHEVNLVKLEGLVIIMQDWILVILILLWTSFQLGHHYTTTDGEEELKLLRFEDAIRTARENRLGHVAIHLPSSCSLLSNVHRIRTW
jgi:hypothetical protein